MAKTIVSIISAQPTPNYLFIREVFVPGDKLMFITSTKMLSNIEPILNTLKWNDLDICKVILKEGEEENWESMCNTIKNCLDSNVHYAVNLTGGTKYMALATQSVFEGFNSEFYYIPFPRNVILTNDKEIPIQTRLSVTEYLSIHGHKIKSRNTIREFSDAKQMLLHFTKTLGHSEHAIINKLRDYRDRDTSISWVETKIDENKKPAIHGLSQFLDKVGFNLMTEDKLSKYESQYLTGGWFEEYVYFLIKNNVSVTDILFGVNLNETNNDLDVVFTKDNRLFVVECKTGIEKGAMLNQIAYKSAALNDYLKGLSSKSFIFALASNNPNWSKIPTSMGIKYFGREYFENEEKTKDLLNLLK